MVFFLLLLFLLIMPLARERGSPKNIQKYTFNPFCHEFEFDFLELALLGMSEL